MRLLLLVLMVPSSLPGCAREPKAAPPDAETEATASSVLTPAAASTPLATSSATSTLGRPCASHAACSAGELCFTDTTCAAGSCQKAVTGCTTKSCDCLASTLCKTVCVDRGACVSCALPPPPP